MRTRNETKARNTRSKDGCFSPHLKASVSKRIQNYCLMMNKNKTQFVEDCVMEKLDVLENDLYESMSKEQLIKLLKSKDGKQMSLFD